MPTQLSANTVGNGRDKFAAESYTFIDQLFSQVWNLSRYLIQLPRHERILLDCFLYLTCPIRIDRPNWRCQCECLTELKAERSKEKFESQAYFDKNTLIAVGIQTLVLMRFKLLSNSLSDGWDERKGIQVEIVAEDFSEDLRSDQLL